ncbi:MAG: hypothetical protein KF800_16540 [Lysobacter sp.]|nr:hypothetical protein [Lysobacter sp.]
MKRYPDFDKAELIAQLLSLTDECLVDIMSEVLPSRTPYSGEPLVRHARMFLGIYSIRDDGDEQPTLEVIAYPDGEIGASWGFCQSGESGIPGIDFVSASKSCLSPFDGRKIHLT